jgi:hypothetical protein
MVHAPSLLSSLGQFSPAKCLQALSLLPRIRFAGLAAPDLGARFYFIFQVTLNAKGYIKKTQLYRYILTSWMGLAAQRPLCPEPLLFRIAREEYSRGRLSKALSSWDSGNLEGRSGLGEGWGNWGQFTSNLRLGRTVLTQLEGAK